MSNVSPDHYHVDVNGMPDGYYIKSMRTPDADILDTGLEVTAGGAGPVEILLSPNAGAVEGVVRNDKSEPAVGATVVLVPKSKERRERVLFFPTGTTDQNGHFTLKNVEPGDYKAFAWEEVEYGAYMDPEFLKPVESKGESVTVRESGWEKVELKVIPAEGNNP